MDTEKTLIEQTLKWLGKLESLDVRPLSGKGEQHKKNMDAYIKDSRHFLEKKDYVRAFEAVIWAWAWAEIGKDIGILDY